VSGSVASGEKDLKLTLGYSLAEKLVRWVLTRA
jgi:hypothetical protein